MSNREVVTLQLGNYSNYVGTHYWNIQEAGFQYDPGAEISEVDYNITFREGQNYHGDVTYTPRMLSVDLKGVLGHLSQDGDLYANDSIMNVCTGKPEISANIPWDFKSIEVVETEEVMKPPYQKDLETMGQAAPQANYEFSSTVKSWSDFMHTRYHPRSINLIREYTHSANEHTFDTFTNGRELWGNDVFREDISDKIRQYIEECDNCQGFQVFFDSIDGFSGITASCFDDINDEYGKSVLAYPLIPPLAQNFINADTSSSAMIRIVNLSMSFASLIDSVSYFVPLSTMSQGWRNIAVPRMFPNVTYDSNNFYQTSAILATFLDTISLKYRAKDSLQPILLPDFCTDLNAYGWKMGVADLGLPFKIQTVDASCDIVNQHRSKPIFTHLTPNSDFSYGQFMHSVVRGVQKSQIAALEPRDTISTEMSVFPYGVASFKMQKYLERIECSKSIQVMSSETSMPIKVPYPEEIFAKIINAAATSMPHMDMAFRISSIPVFAAVSSTNVVQKTIDSLHTEAEKVKLGKIYRFKETGLEVDEYREVLHKLLDFRDLYDERTAL